MVWIERREDESVRYLGKRRGHVPWAISDFLQRQWDEIDGNRCGKCRETKRNCVWGIRAYIGSWPESFHLGWLWSCLLFVWPVSNRPRNQYRPPSVLAGFGQLTPHYSTEMGKVVRNGYYSLFCVSHGVSSCSSGMPDVGESIHLPPL